MDNTGVIAPRASRELAALLALAAVMVAALLLRVEAATHKRCLFHDEGISYLLAAAKLSDYQRPAGPEHPAGRWAPGAAWRAYFAVDRPLALAKVREDLAALDVHPPLYFWLLHVTASFTGLGLTTGAALNIALHALGLLLMALVARQLTGSRLAALAALSLWTFNAATYSTTFISRQYELLTLWTLAALWLLSRVIRAPLRRSAYAGLGLVCGLGLLTHFQFAHLMVATFLLALLLCLGLKALPRRALLWLAGAFLLAATLLLVLHPDAVTQVQKIEQWRRPFSVQGMLQRGANIALVFRRALWSEESRHSLPQAAGVLLLVAGLALSAARAWRRLRRQGQEGAATQDVLRLSPILLSLFLLTQLSAQYLSFVAPRHAMNDRYLAMLWPTLALALVSAGASLLRGRALVALLVACAAGAMTCGVLFRHESAYLCKGGPPYGDLPGRYPALIVDNVVRGRMPKLLFSLAPGAAVFAAPQQDILSRPEVIDRLTRGLAGRPRLLLLSMLGYGSTEAGRRYLLAGFSGRGFQVRELQGGTYAAYELTRPHGP